MPNAASFPLDENWHGGYYELALELGPHRDTDADTRLLEALVAIWQEPGLDGCFLDRGVEPEHQHRVEPIPLDLNEPGHLLGRATLPTGARVVCGTWVSTYDDGADWLGFYLPLGALNNADPRVGAFPFPGPPQTSSRLWRERLDDWLAGIALRVRSLVEFRVGLIGFEASTPGDPWDGEIPDERWIGYMIPTGDTATFWPANTWDADPTP